MSIKSFNLFILILLWILIDYLIVQSTSSTIGAVGGASSGNSFLCDYDKFTHGCEDSTNSYCQREISRCICKQGYPIRLFKYCLKYAKIDETCYTSRQCNETPNAACYILGTEYDHSGSHHVGSQLSDWPKGTCKCRTGHQYDPFNNTCIKKTIGSWCNYDRTCNKEIVHSYCNKQTFKCDCVYGYIYDPEDDTCTPQQLYGSKCNDDDACARESLICLAGRCRCPKDFHVDLKLPGFLCKPNNDSACNIGYKWDDFRERCIPKSIHVNQRGKQMPIDISYVNDLEIGHDSDLPISISTVIMSIIASGMLIMILRYCLCMKREDSEEDLAERHIRPTHMLHKQHLVRGDLGCAMINDEMIINGEVKCPQGDGAIFAYGEEPPLIQQVMLEDDHKENTDSNDSGVKTTDDKSENELKESPLNQPVTTETSYCDSESTIDTCTNHNANDAGFATLCDSSSGIDASGGGEGGGGGND